MLVFKMKSREVMFSLLEEGVFACGGHHLNIQSVFPYGVMVLPHAQVLYLSLSLRINKRESTMENQLTPC
jgi:hypothetical protein